MDLLQSIDKELKENVDLKYKEWAIRYFKEEVNPICVRGKIVDRIGLKYFKEIRHFYKKQILNTCEQLLETGQDEKISIVFDWAFRLRKNYEESDFKIFARWLKKHVSNWASCDDFCTHAFGYFILKFPEFLKDVRKWTKSNNRWNKRASAVILIYSNRKDKNIEFAFKIADILLKDSDDLVQKGYGWMLKEISNIYPKKIFEYVMKNKKDMPRTSLRYAIEKLSVNLKKECMLKN